CSYKAWDDTAYAVVENEDGTYSEQLVTLTQNADGSGELPMNYVVTYGKTLEDCITVGEQVRTNLEDGMKADRYNKEANEFGIEYTDTIVYYAKVYKSLWKDLQ
ncbi:MAG: hypothetical protein IKC54_01675, partial [Clostridia bacterium]|nr:hypothetical protein [Clostridia bacterium]